MRKIYIASLCLFAFFFRGTQSAAQVSIYTFAQSSGTYTSITGGTVLGTATANTIAGSIDDQNFTIATGSFPFTFNYNGVGYTGCNVNTNGYITFGATLPATNGYTPISAATAYDGAIAAFGGDINSVFSIASTTGELRWETVGSAPNREVVIQWQNYRPAFSTSTTNAYVFDFQIRLGENGIIKMVYGGTLGYLIGSTAIASTKQIGLRGLTNTDFNNRTNTTGILFTASTAGTLNNSTQAYNTITSPPGMPTTGLTYTWLPPPPCVPGSLNGGTTQGPAGTICAGSGFTLSVTSASFGTGITYVWESSLNGTTWNPTGVTTPTLTTNALTNTYYRRKMTCAGVDAYSTSLLVTVSAPLPLPLTEGFNTTGTAVFPTCWSQQIITGTGNITFQTNTTNPTTTPFEGTRYAYWNSFSIGNNSETRLVSPAIVTTGTASVYVQFYWDNDNNPAYSTGQYLLEGVQVQYSLNGTTWIDAGSFIPRHDPTLASGTSQWKLKKVTLPAAAGNQSAILVGFKFHSGFGDNCSMDAVNILSTPVCVDPSGLTISTVTTTSATLSWTASISSPACGYQWEVRTSGAGGSGAVGLVANGATGAGVTTANAAGLTANTSYTLYVRADCCSGSFSPWAGPVSFTTLCNATNVPYTQNFDAAVTPNYPSCFSVEDLNGATTWKMWYAGGVVASSLPNSIRYEWNGSTPANDWFYIQGLNLTGGKTYYLSFKYKGSDGAFGYVEKLEVKYGTSPQASAMTSGTIFTNTNITSNFDDPFAEPSVAFTPAVTGVYYIGFHAFSDADQAFLYVDDIKVETCPSPTSVTAVATLPTTVQVNFTSPGTAFIVEYGAPGFTPGTDNNAGVGGTLVFGASSPITVGPPGNPLTPNTTYDFYIRRICIPGVDYSANIKVTATTLCTPVNIPYTENFDGATPPAIPSCTSIQDLNGAPTWATITAPVAWGFEGNSLRYLYSATKPANDWFFTRGLNLTAGTLYQVSFKYGATDPLYPERMRVAFGTSAVNTAMVNTIADFPNIVANSGAPFANKVKYAFTPATTGTYYLGFQVYSLADEFQLFLDSINVKAVPPVDVGVSGLILPALTCPTNGVFVQATITNYNLIPVNFATYPDTVTAIITGAGTGTLTGIVNTGTLAAGASMTIYLSPAFNFSSGGTYNIKTYTSSRPFDPEPGNDTLYSSINVNPIPPTPVITPSAPQVCLGSTVQLTVPTPAAITSSVTATSTTPVPILDGVAAGSTGTINISGIPSTATITGISVTLNVTHTWINDVVVNLKSPNGVVLNLFNRKGAAATQNMVNTVINSTSTTPIPAAGAPFTGVYMPDAGIGVGPSADLSTAAGFPNLYTGTSGNGNWIIGLRDYVLFDAGALTSWSITITYSYIPALTWTPVTDLYTNAGATTPYTAGTNAYSVYVKPATTGSVTYTATATGAGGCTSTGTVVVTTNPIPVITVGSIPDTVCISDPLIPLVANPVGGSWSGIGVSGTNFVPPATGVGTYILTYTYTSAAGCATTATKKIVVKDCPERNILLRDNAVLLFPNPNNGQFNIRINSVLYNNLLMKVYTNNGVLVTMQQLGGLAWGRVVPIDLTNLPGGVYMVKFYYDGGTRTAEKTFKVIIGHQ